MGGGVTTGTGGSASGNCVANIISMGYAYTGAMPCSACYDNTTSREMKCRMMIDCLEPKYPCITGDCFLNCLNPGGSSVDAACVNALLNAACMP